MNVDQARECADILAAAYGLGTRRVAWYADMLERFNFAAAATVIMQWVEREKAPPTIAAIKAGVRQQLESTGAKVNTFTDRGDRMEKIVVWRSILEDSGIGQRDYDDAHDRVRWMNPPCTQQEWRDARQIADQRHKERNQQLLSEGKKPRPPRPPMSWPEPPGPSEPQTTLSREAHRAGFAALFSGLRQKLQGDAMVAHVMDAVRAAEAEARRAQP